MSLYAIGDYRRLYLKNRRKAEFVPQSGEEIIIKKFIHNTGNSYLYWSL